MFLSKKKSLLQRISKKPKQTALPNILDISSHRPLASSNFLSNTGLPSKEVELSTKKYSVLDKQNTWQYCQMNAHGYCHNKTIQGTREDHEGHGTPFTTHDG